MTDERGTDNDEDDIRRLLQTAGRREALPEHLKLQWEQQFRAQLSEAQASRRRRRTGLAGVLAACVALAAVTLVMLPDPARQVPAIRVVDTVGESALSNRDGQTLSLLQGQEIAFGARLSTGTDGMVALAWGGYDVRINVGSELALEATGLTLSAGEIYVSDDDRAAGEFRLNIHTPHGRIRDVGTQFSVQVTPRQTLTRVRRGAVILDTGAAEHRSEARNDGAVLVTMDGGGGVDSESVAGSGAAWRWIYAAGPAFALDGRTAWDFLQWSVGESGLSLEFASAAAERYARSTLLHGSIGDLDPERAVHPVLAATELSATVADGRLVIAMDPTASEGERYPD